MFKKLRNTFLIQTMVIISILMVISFTIIYMITYSNIQSKIDEDLSRLRDFKVRSFPVPYSRNSGELFNHEPLEQVGPERAVAFVAEMDMSHALTRIFTYFDAEDAFYQEAFETALSTNSSSGNFELDDNYWAFRRDSIPGGERLTFINVTTQYAVLKKLATAFIWVGLFMFILVYAVSRYLSQKAIAPVERAFEKQKQFISDASHELKTPLTVIGANVDVLLPTADEDSLKWLHYIKTEVQRMGKLTQDLLYLAQLDSAQSNSHIQTRFSLTSILEHHMLGFEGLAFEKNISFQYALAPDMMVSGVAEHIEQVIMILLDNAIKYTPMQGSVHVTLERLGHHTVFTITNTGDGIAKEDLPFIFDRFYRGDASRNREAGSYGLGLAIAQSILNDHHSKLVCTSTNESTTFQFRLK